MVIKRQCVQLQGDVPDENERAVNIIQSFWASALALRVRVAKCVKQVAYASAIESKQKALNHTSK